MANDMSTIDASPAECCGAAACAALAHLCCGGVSRPLLVIIGSLLSANRKNSITLMQVLAAEAQHVQPQSGRRCALGGGQILVYRVVCAPLSCCTTAHRGPGLPRPELQLRLLRHPGGLHGNMRAPPRRSQCVP